MRPVAVKTERVWRIRLREWKETELARREAPAGTDPGRISTGASRTSDGGGSPLSYFQYLLVGKKTVPV